ncbi:hypothetical protein Pcac1_g28240 [Phytophthora cactorum]|nr:hypothetical protein Pcac1_g28240 [Phytophthora cactorum]
MELGLAEQPDIAATAAEGWAICNGPAPQEDSVKQFPPRPLGLKGRWQKPRPPRPGEH